MSRAFNKSSRSPFFLDTTAPFAFLRQYVDALQGEQAATKAIVAAAKGKGATANDNYLTTVPAL